MLSVANKRLFGITASAGLVRYEYAKTWRDRFEDMGGWAQIPERGFSMKKTSDRGEIFIYEQIGEDWWTGGGVTAKKFADELKALGDVSTIDIRINSPGGDVWEANAIYSQLNQHKATKNVYVDGLAASAASYIAMAGDSIKIAEHAQFMIHNAWGLGMGNATELRALAAVLEGIDGTIRNIYAKRTGQDDAKIKDWMEAETWFTGKEAVENKFADEMIPVKAGKAEDSVRDLMKMRLELARVS